MVILLPLVFYSQEDVHDFFGMLRVICFQQQFVEVPERLPVRDVGIFVDLFHYQLHAFLSRFGVIHCLICDDAVLIVAFLEDFPENATLDFPWYKQ